MGNSSQLPQVVRFGVFEVDLRSGELRKSGTRIKLQEQPFQLLAALLERPGGLVTREELQSKLWPDDTYVDFDRSLTTATSRLREALGDSASTPRFVETLPRRGYRFIAPVDAAGPTRVPPTSVSESGVETSSEVKRSLTPRLLIAGGVIFFLGLSALLVSRSPRSGDSVVSAPGPTRGPQRAKPLTSFIGAETPQSWSPDGRFMLINREHRGSFDLYVMDRSSGELTRLTDDSADDWCARWSPDGRWVAYLSNEGAGENVYLVPPIGGQRRKLAETNIPYLGGDIHSALGNNPWSPDSRELLFSRMQPNARIALWKIHLDTGEETQVTDPPPNSDDFLAAWSFDGASIVFSRRKAKRYGLWVLTADSRRPEPLLVNEFDHTHPAWAPDNKRIVFESNRVGSTNLWEITIPTRRLRQLTTGPGSERRPIISNQGELAYTRFRARTALYLLDLATGSESQIVHDMGRSYQPRLSPDGNKVVYKSDRTGNYDLWTLDLLTGQEQQLTRDLADDEAPDWAPDGKRLVFFSNRGKGPKIWMARADGGPFTPLADLVASTKERGAGPKWSPDGKVIGCVAPSDQGRGLWVVDVETGVVKPVLDNVAEFGWYKDSRRVVYSPTAVQGQQSDLIKVSDLETAESRVLLEAPNIELAVAPDGSAVTFAGGSSHIKQSLWLLRLKESEGTDGLPLPSGLPERLTDGGDVWHVHNGGWSWDGKSVVYVRESVEADVYLLESYR